MPLSHHCATWKALRVTTIQTLLKRFKMLIWVVLATNLGEADSAHMRESLEMLQACSKLEGDTSFLNTEIR